MNYSRKKKAAIIVYFVFVASFPVFPKGEKPFWVFRLYPINNNL